MLKCPFVRVFCHAFEFQIWPPFFTFASSVNASNAILMSKNLQCKKDIGLRIFSNPCIMDVCSVCCSSTTTTATFVSVFKVLTGFFSLILDCASQAKQRNALQLRQPQPKRRRRRKSFSFLNFVSFGFVLILYCVQHLAAEWRQRERVREKRRRKKKKRQSETQDDAREVREMGRSKAWQESKTK